MSLVGIDEFEKKVSFSKRNGSPCGRLFWEGGFRPEGLAYIFSLTVLTGLLPTWRCSYSGKDKIILK